MDGFHVTVTKAAKVLDGAMDGANKILDDFGRMFDVAFESPSGGEHSSNRKVTNWKVTKKTVGELPVVLIEIEVPGCKKDEVRVELDDRTLSISWKSRMTGENRRRDFSISAKADAESVTAKVEDGYLTVTVPAMRTDVGAPKKVRVE